MNPASGTPEGDVRALLGIADVSCLISDALSELGIGWAAGIPGMSPFGSARQACGPAFTVRYELAADAGRPPSRDGDPDFDFHRLFGRARRGDVALMECPAEDLAILGSRGASWARHFGLAGCVVNGAVRDVEALAVSDMPVWARHVTPMAGRGQLIQAEVGGPVSLGGVVANQGDFVVADGNGLAVIPGDSLAAVLRIAADLQRVEAAAARAAKPG
jgi:4-hydroxy-4-methyl-2-oxoglutarate aldolase